LIIDQSHSDRAYRPAEGHAGYHQRRRRRVDSQDVQPVLAVRGEGGQGNLNFTASSLGKEGPQRSVGQPANENPVLAGPSLATEKAARDATGSVQAFLVVHGEGKEIGSLSRWEGGRSRRQQHSITSTSQHSTVGLTRQLAGFEYHLYIRNLRCESTSLSFFQHS